MTVAVVCGKSSLLSNIQSQTASFVTLANTTYSASTIDIATIACFFDDYEIDPPAILNIYLLIDFLESRSWAQLALLQPTRLIDLSFFVLKQVYNLMSL